jgi:hypothetical protein
VLCSAAFVSPVSPIFEPNRKTKAAEKHRRTPDQTFPCSPRLEKKLADVPLLSAE